MTVSAAEGWEGCGLGINGTQHNQQGRPVVNSTKFSSLGSLVSYGHLRGDLYVLLHITALHNYNT